VSLRLGLFLPTIEGLRGPRWLPRWTELRELARLAEQVGIDRSGTSRYADRLQEAGLIKRTTDPLDRRATLLSLTPKGARVIGKLNATLTDHLRALTAAWPPGSAGALADGLALLLDGPATPAARLGTAPGVSRRLGRPAYCRS